MSYTMFISGITRNDTIDPSGKVLNTPATETVMIFDSIENYNISHPNEKTGFAIEDRSNVTDHVFSPDSKFSFVGRVTSSPMIIRPNVEWDKGVDRQNPKATDRIKLAYETLLKARNERSGISISCAEFDLTNYVITNLDFNREGSAELGVFNITLEEMRTVTIGTTVLATGVGAGGKKSDVEGRKGNVSKGNTQDANGNKPKREVVETLNMNSKTTDMFSSKCAGGRTEFCQVVPESQKTEKFTLGLDKS